jgi:multidrug efflux pump subunit AcrB
VNRLIDAVVRSRVASHLILLAMLAAGGLTMSGIDVRLFPETVPGKIQVTVPYPGATPEEVEAAVVEPVEERVRSLEGVRRVRATATADLGRVVVDLYRGEDVDEARDAVRSAVDRITVFPAETERPEVVEVEPREQILQLVVHGDLDADTRGVRTVKALAERVRRDLTTLPGVSQAEVGGVPTDLVEIAVPRTALDALDTTLAEIATLVSASSREFSAGVMDTDRDRLLVRTLGEKESADALREVVLRTAADGSRVRLGDVAEVREALADEGLITRLDGRPAALVTIFRAGDERVLEVVETVETYLAEDLRPRLPESLAAEVWRNDGRLLEGRLRLLVKNGALGLLLVLVVLTLFLDLRVAAWVAAGIGAAFVGAFALMGVFGVALNVISLFGFILAIGIVVDDAIVVGENVYARQMAPPEGTSALDRAIGAAQRVSRPVFFAVSTTIATFVPLLFLPGTIGQFIDQIAAIVIFTLLLSLLESFLVLPRHLAHLEDRAPRRFSPRRLTAPARRRVQDALEAFSRGPLARAVHFAVRHPAVTLSAAVALLVTALALPAGGWIKFVFFPEVQGNYVTARLELAQNTPETRTLAVAQRIEAAAAEAAEAVGEDYGLAPEQVLDRVLVTVGSLPGAADPGAQRPAGQRPQFAALTARIMDAEVRPFDAAEFSAAWREATAAIPGERELSFSASLVNIGAPVALEVSADDEATVDAAVARLREELAGLDGVHDVRDDRFRNTDEITLALRPAARSYGLTVADVGRTVREALYGAEALRVQRGREEVRVRVRLPKAERDGLDDLRELEIVTADGGRVPLATVAEIGERPAPARIRRVDGRRIVTLAADTDPDRTSGGEATSHLLGTVVPELKARHPDLRVAVAGEQEERARTAPALLRNFALELFAIYALLALAFDRFTQPFVIMAVMPFGLIGVILGHLLLGLNLTLLSVFGLVGLTGVLVNDALLLIDFAEERLTHGEDLPTAVAEAAKARFRPILLTSLTTFFGVAPLILETSVQAQFLIPTAVALGFGILAGTAVLMLVVPALAVLHGRLFPRPADG